MDIVIIASLNNDGKYQINVNAYELSQLKYALSLMNYKRVQSREAVKLTYTPKNKDRKRKIKPIIKIIENDITK